MTIINFLRKIDGAGIILDTNAASSLRVLCTFLGSVLQQRYGLSGECPTPGNDKCRGKKNDSEQIILDLPLQSIEPRRNSRGIKQAFKFLNVLAGIVAKELFELAFICSKAEVS